MAAPNGDATMDVDNDSDYAPSESNHSDGFLKDVSEGSDMEDVTTVSVKPSSDGRSPTLQPFSIQAAKRTDRAPTRILCAMQLAFGPVAPPANVDVRELPLSQSNYSTFASPNPFEWLSEGEGGKAPADQDLILWDGSNPPQAVASYIKLPKQSERAMNSAVVTSSAEKASLEQVSEIIETYLKEFADIEDADEALYSIQVQPSVHRFLLATSTPSNYQHLRSKVMNHAVLRIAARKLNPNSKDYSLNDDIIKILPNATILSSQTVLDGVCGTTNDFWLQLNLAEFELALQIIASSIYMDKLKLSEKKAQLVVKLQEHKHYASQKKFAVDLKDAEKWSKFFFRPPQILHNTPIPVDSPEELDTMCDEFNHFWSGVYRSPSKEFSHPKPKWNRLQMAEILQHTTAHLTPEQAAYMDSPLAANDFYWAIKHTTAGKASGQRLLNLVEQFCQASGMELNKNKIVVLLFRPWDSDTGSPRVVTGSWPLGRRQR
ncbi:hypothetical protein PF002_g19136 [Phytophthora fragariae]|uniref:Uncharacterized protein n=1 Tax=Phytophthora fragariae TaxID=53985 RepID=A0A6A3XVV7_9STRA|nr:hypothetical protein PF002_g19136 [Phytophthora fragariae]